MTQKTELKKELGFWAATSIVIGCVIGSGVFVKPASVLASVAGTNSALIAWLCGGLLTIAGGLTIAEVAVRIPKTGGVYTYIEEIYGQTAGFLCGWVQTIIYGPGVTAALALYFGLLARNLLGLDQSWQPVLAYSGLGTLIAINCIGAKYAAKVQELTTAIKLLPIIAIVGAGLFWGDQATTGVTLSAAATGSLGAAILSTLWAYDGWMQVACVAGEMKNPGRDLPRAIIAGLLVVVAAYLAVNFALLKVLGAEKLVEFGPDAARIASEAMFGSMGGLLISSGIVISIFGCLNGHVFSNPRVPYAMAVRKELPFSQWLGAVHPRFQTPINATLFQAAIAVGMMMLASNIDQITDLAIFSIYIFFTAAFAGVIVLRRRAGAKRDKLSYHVPLYPIVPLIAIAGSLFMLVSSILDKPILLGYFFVMAISGLPFRLAIMKRRRGVREL